MRLQKTTEKQECQLPIMDVLSFSAGERMMGRYLKIQKANAPRSSETTSKASKTRPEGKALSVGNLGCVHHINSMHFLHVLPNEEKDFVGSMREKSHA